MSDGGLSLPLAASLEAGPNVNFGNLAPRNSMLSRSANRPLLPAGTPKALADVLRWCWSSEPERRPNFADVVKLLQRARSKMGEAELAWLDAPLGHRPKPREGAKRRPSGDARHHQTPRGGGEARPSASRSEASMDT